MAIKLNDHYLSSFMRPHEYERIAPEVRCADAMLRNNTGAGNDFLGWVNLPENYDKEEFARIKAAAAKIQKTCDVLIVIGIGGSYLGARAVIEYLKSPNYNLVKKGTPEIYFTGNCISADALNEVLSGKWRNLRGLEIVSFGVSSVKASEEDEQMIKELQRNAAFMDPTRAAAHLVGAQASAMQAAAANQGAGPAMAFMGMNMAGQMGGMNAQNLYQMGAQQQAQQPAPAAPAAPANGWTCNCGQSGITGNFCPNCGSKKPEPKPAAGSWKCPQCGAALEPGASFCTSCGAKIDDSDDVTYCALDEATKKADCKVVYAKSFYAGAANANTKLAGEIIGILAAPNPAEAKAGLEACVDMIENVCHFVSANDDDSICYYAHCISRTGSYLSEGCGIAEGEAIAYLIAPPLEAM